MEDYCDAIDLNLGCPQRIAKKGHYGAFLMEDQELIYELGESEKPFFKWKYLTSSFKLVSTLHKYLKVPIFCKIRIFPEFEKTLNYALMLEKAGCQLLTIHARTREMKGFLPGPADWSVIRRIK